MGRDMERLGVFAVAMLLEARARGEVVCVSEEIMSFAQQQKYDIQCKPVVSPSGEQSLQFDLVFIGNTETGE